MNLENLARETRDAAREAGRTQQQRELEQAVARNEEAARKLLTQLLANSPLAEHASDAVVSRDDPATATVLLTLDGITLMFVRTSGGGWDYGERYDPHFLVMARCTCEQMDTPKRGRVTSLSSLADALDAPRPTACDMCFDESKVETPPPAPTAAENLVAAIERFVDERLPEVLA